MISLISADQVAGVLPTRGDVPLPPLLDHLPFDEIAVWSNDQEEDLGVYGRYAAIERTTKPVSYTQDDDVVVPAESVERLLAAYQPGRIVANMPQEFRSRYPDSCLIGFGAIFDRDLPEEAFARIGLGPDCSPFPGDEWWNLRYRKDGVVIEIEHSDIFRRTCDVVFTTLTPRTLVDVPITMLEHTWAHNRMYRAPNHTKERQQMLRLCRRIRDRMPA